MAKQVAIILEVMIIMLINKNTRFKYCSTKKKKFPLDQKIYIFARPNLPTTRPKLKYTHSNKCNLNTIRANLTKCKLFELSSVPEHFPV